MMLGIIDAIPMVMIGLGLYAKFANDSEPVFAFLKEFLPQNYTDAITILCGSLTPEKTDSDSSGLAGFFYLPHRLRYRV